MLILPLSSAVCASGQGIIHQQVLQQTVARDVIYKNITRFTDTGWQNIHILEMNLDSPYSRLELLIPEKGIQSGSTLEQMTDGRQVVAAINGDFFISGNYYSPVGTVVENGEIYSSPTYRSDELAVFSLSDRNVPMVDYWDWSIALEIKGQKLDISAGLYWMISKGPTVTG